MKKYAVMRHSKHDDLDDKVFNENKTLVEDAVNKLFILLNKHNINSLVIWHSPLPRAIDTANYFREVFLKLNTDINIKENEEKPFLYNRKREIQNNLNNLPSDFVLIIGHFSDIVVYGLSEYGKETAIENCTILYEGEVI